ncbi:hypothetical protein V7S43_001744 [Phytophthora oleae]|uniref:BED-type domain-containing protein n=1 Tax=Phytophthora oleae TaxID=2107226 RepID=A0ABD3G372_9STRA
MSETPSSTSGISASSAATVVDLRDVNQEDRVETVRDVNEDDNVETSSFIPDEISHGPQANDFIWQIVHKLDKEVPYRGKEFTHICLECNATNAKSHLVSKHKTHPEAAKENKRRLQRANRFTVKTDTKITDTADTVTEVTSKRQRTSEPKGPGAKRRSTFWTPPFNQDKVTAHISRWLIRDGLPHHMITTPAFRELLVGITGNPSVTVPSLKTYNDILDKSYESFQEDTKELLSGEFKELHETRFLTVEHDLCTNQSKSTIVGASCGFIDRQW